MTGIEAIAKEREEQLNKHNRSVIDDAILNSAGQLRWAAKSIIEGDPLVPAGWDTKIFLKIIEKPLKERVVIAAALLAAEYDRLEFEENFPKEKLIL